jgi:hypothetical protein
MVCFAVGEDTNILEAFVADTFEFMVDKYIVSPGTWLVWGGGDEKDWGEETWNACKLETGLTRVSSGWGNPLV